MSYQRIGRYEILGTLGQGAMGVVYLANDPLIDRQVALKTLRLDLGPEAEAEFGTRFRREARAAGRLNHPAIVTVHDVGEDAETGLFFIAMEYVEGRDLRQILELEERLHPVEAARIVAEVALALDSAHRTGVVHRDIKPANIVLTPDGLPKIMDFGVARLESSNLTVEGQFVGTPSFMAPEQITGGTVDGRSDLFSLGVVLFYLLTGKRPFTGKNMHEITLKITQAPCPIPSTVRPELPAGFNPIVLKCLEKDPDKRFQTGGELADVLAAVVRSLPAYEPAPREPTRTTQATFDSRVAAAAARSKRLATEAPPEPIAATVAQRPAKPRKLTFWDRLPIPETARREIVPSRFWAAALAVAAIILGPVMLAEMLRDRGPWPAPSPGAMSNRYETLAKLQRARSALHHGKLIEAETTCQQALHQAPSSPAGRALMAEINRALANEESILASRERFEGLVDEGRSHYREGRYSIAIESFEGALEIDPEDDLAASYLELAQDRLSDSRRRPVAQSTPSAETSGETRRTATPRREKPGTGLAKIMLIFNSPLNAGVFEITIDGQLLTEVPFDFTRKTFLGIKRKGSGTVRRTLVAPSGRHTLEVTLRSGELAAPASARFTETLAGDSEWSLRVDQPGPESRPAFFLVRAHSSES